MALPADGAVEGQLPPKGPDLRSRFGKEATAAQRALGPVGGSPA
ncbi:hypothetical protein ACIBI9_52550 [Nonomuraea sp. NPDC050451]